MLILATVRGQRQADKINQKTVQKLITN